MKKIKKYLIVGLSLLGLIAITAGVAIKDRPNDAEAKTYKKAVTKIAGNKNYAIYHKVSKKGPRKKFTSTKYFKHAQIQSKKYKSTKKGKYWKIIVDGRTVGWVNQNFFARNKISVAPEVSLVWNSNYSFPTKDAINYVTDSKGTAIDSKKVTVSKSSVPSDQPGVTEVTYSYGKAQAKSTVTVRDDTQEDKADINQPAKTGPKEVSTWKGSSKSSSKKWSAKYNYQPETSSNKFKSNGLTLKTRLFQPRFLSLDYNKAKDKMGQVGVVPEGITVKHGIFVVSVYSSSKSKKGHLVSYNLNKIKSKYAAQNMTTMRWSKFKKYAKNIKISPYIKMGHGQSLGSTKKYIYVIANDNHNKNLAQAEEVMQIRKSDMKIKKIWTFHINRRYIHNATFANDHTMYCLFHNGSGKSYEYWKVTRSQDTWTPVEVGKTASNFIKNGSPVQAFAYDPKHNNFYVGFNDYLFKVAKDGTYKKKHHFKTKRELEGLSVSGSKLYVELAQRGELLAGKTK